MRVSGLITANSRAQVALLRSLALVLQLILSLFAADTFGLSLQLDSLVLIWVLEALYLGFTLRLGKALFATRSGLFVALAVDSLFWISWLYFSGGATNAFISLLLLPIALAAVTLPIWAPWLLTLLSTLAYSLMLFSLPAEQMQHHGMDMSSHYLGMWLNFLISALVMTTSVAVIASRMRRQDAELAYMREAQLRQEQLLALGTASAQMAHQLATPLSSLRLLHDEIKEDIGGPSVSITEMDAALSRCEHTLNELRSATEFIRSGRQVEERVDAVIRSLRQKILLLMPQTRVDWLLDAEADALARICILTDMSLIPAIMALLENAVRANLEHAVDAEVHLSVRYSRPQRQLCIGIRDFGPGIAPELLAQLGSSLVRNPKGMGAALLLSHASLERLGGKLLMGNHPEGGTVAEIWLPVLRVAEAEEDGMEPYVAAGGASLAGEKA
ncbi:ATP-binding protein [Shewanella salipaludis]|uniref:histidine kinase n=1 Tax=Shewanella salipaludis TaxID=2723052 RepID=A0A972JK67_9GAMM|nr:HAMP domain-containing histidine kinase [Shewanella salipaludis]